MDVPIKYRFVEYRRSSDDNHIVVGTFHKWNDTYYIDISYDLINDNRELAVTVIHETRHLIVAYLYDKKVIDLLKYTEEIAQEKDTCYNNLFDSGVYLLNNGLDQKMCVQR